MAKIRAPVGTTLPMSQATVRIRGRFITYIHKGNVVAASWPRKRPGKPTPAQQEQRDEFARLAQATKDVDPIEQASAREMAEGSKYTWRDIMSLAMTGQLLDIPNYGEIVAQYTLDILGKEPGMIPMRNDLAWVALPIGAEDDVLQVVGGLPAWVTPPVAPTTGPAPHPGMASGRLYLPSIASTLTSGTLAANILWAYPICIPDTYTLNTIRIQVNGTGTATLAELGVYNNLRGLPNTLLLDAGTVTTTGTGTKIKSGLTQVLAPGWYWIVAALNGTCTVTTMAATTSSPAVAQGVATLTAGQGQYAFATGSWTFAANTLPGTFPSPIPSTTTIPAIAITVA
jgi:hypothetical protein